MFPAGINLLRCQVFFILFSFLFFLWPGVFLEAKEAEDKHEVRGFLSCKGAKDRGSKRSWCVLMDRIIYFYKASEDVAAVKTMPVLGWKLSQVGRNVCFS